MNLKRLRIVRKDEQVFADDSGTLLRVTNPEEVSLGSEDGIFTLDRGHRTATYESRRAELPLTVVANRNFVPGTTPETHVTTLPDGTVHVWLLDGAVLVTLKDDRVWVDAPLLPKQVRRLIGAMALEGVVISTPAFAKALRYILED